jgi:pilus assembly protein CpaB
VITSDVAPRQLLLRGAFDEPSRVSGGLALPEGKLAVSVQMSAPEQVAGYVRPGAKIAIFDTFTAGDSKSQLPSGERLTFGAGVPQVTRVLLPRVEVIAIGTHDSPGSATSGNADKADATKSESTQSTSLLIVTVAVTQLEAERLVHAVQTGTLYLALLDESSNVTTGPGVDNKSLFP